MCHGATTEVMCVNVSVAVNKFDNKLVKLGHEQVDVPTSGLAVGIDWKCLNSSEVLPPVLPSTDTVSR